MRPDGLKRAIRDSAMAYAQSNGLVVDERHSSALIFSQVQDALCPASFNAIRANPDWLARTWKCHPNVHSALEMQSSNSSDGLLMSVFCHPKLPRWKGVSDLLGFRPVDPVFGFLALVAKAGTQGDKTEIDMVISDYFVEAKLTEASFTDSPASNVRLYEQFSSCFFAELLRMRNDCFCNYQIIRNILAATQYGKRHKLICDERRSDLVREYMMTVSCIRDERVRIRCRVVFWQEIGRVAGRELATFLASRYGIC